MKGIVKLVALAPNTKVKTYEQYIYENRLIEVTKDAVDFGMRNSHMASFKNVKEGTSHYCMMVSVLHKPHVVDSDTGDLIPLCQEYFSLVADFNLNTQEVDFEYIIAEDQIPMAKLVLPSDKFYTETSVINHLSSICNFATELVKRKPAFTEEDITSLIEAYWNNNKNFQK